MSIKNFLKTLLIPNKTVTKMKIQVGLLTFGYVGFVGSPWFPWTCWTPCEYFFKSFNAKCVCVLLTLCCLIVFLSF